MNELTIRNQTLPDTLPELSKFVLVGREKLNAVRAEIRAIDKIGLAQEVREQKLHEAQDIADAVLDAEVKIGELTQKIPKSSGRYSENKNRPVAKNIITSDMGMTKDQVNRFEHLARNPAAVQQAKQTAREEDRIVTRQDALNIIKKPHVSNNSGDNEWYTPAEYIEAAREVMGCIDLDPASNDYANRTVKAAEYYTEETDGLTQTWYGNIWMNPPYSSALIKQFADKLAESDFEQAVILVNNATETAWFSRMVSKASAVAFPTGRIKFEKADRSRNTPLQGQAFIYCGTHPDKFIEVFSRYGWCARL